MTSHQLLSSSICKLKLEINVYPKPIWLNDSSPIITMITTIDYIFDKISYLGDQKNRGYEKYKKVFLGKNGSCNYIYI